MALCKNDIRLSLEAQIGSELNSGSSVQEINDRYTYAVVAEDKAITIPEELINKYWEVNQPKRNIDTQLRSKYFASGDTTSASTILRSISTSSHPLSMLAKKLMDYTHLADSTITLSEEDLPSLPTNPAPTAVYNNSDKSIKLGLNSDYKGLGSEPTILHEILHSYTVEMIDKHPTHPLVQELNNVLDFLKKQKGIKDTYPLTNTKELVAEFFTNAQFIKDLQNIPSQNKFSTYRNVWQEILDYITSLFKFDRNEKNFYEELFPLMTNVVEQGAEIEGLYQTLINPTTEEYFSQQQDVYDTYEEANNYSEGSKLKDLSALTEEINRDNPEVFAQVGYNPEEPSLLKIEPFSKNALPSNFSRRTIDKRFHSNEVANMSLEIVTKKLSRVFPAMTFKEVEQSDLKQEEHAFPVSEINAFVKGNVIHLVKGKFDTSTKIEEILHPFVLGMAQKNRELFENIHSAEKGNYQDVHDKYSKLSEEDAKIEVVTRALRDAVSNQAPKSYLEQFKSFLKRVFSKLFPAIKTEHISTSSTIGDVADLILNSGYKFESHLSNKPYYSATNKSEEGFNALKSFAQRNGVKKLGTDAGYVNAKGEKVLRVTEVKNENDDKKFTNIKTPEQEARNEAGKQIGISAHAAIDDVLARHIDKDSGLRKASQHVDPKRNLNGLALSEYKKIEEATLERLNSYPIGTRFMWENVGFDPFFRQGAGLAGTQDFVAFLPNGKIHLLDWKFIISHMNENIPGWKKEVYEFQLQHYVEMIKIATGATDEDFERVRIIPFIVDMNKDNTLKSITTPSINIASDALKNRRLLPYVSMEEYVADPSLKFFIEKLKNIPKKIAERQAVEQDKDARVDSEVENFVENAITDFTLLGKLDKLFIIHKDLATDAAIFLKDIEKATSAETIDPLNAHKLSKTIGAAYGLIQSINDFTKAAEVIYGDNLQNDVTPGEEETKAKAKFRELIGEVSTLEKNHAALERAIFDKFAKNEGIIGILKEEKKVSSYDKNATFLDSPETRSSALFGSIMNKVWNKLTKIVNDGYIEMENLTHRVIKEQNARGKSSEDIINMLTDTDDKGQYNGKLKTKFKEEFYADRSSAFESKDLKTVNDFYSKWYDLDAYKAWSDEYLKEKFADIDADTLKDTKQKDRAKNNLKYYYDLETSLQAYHSVHDSKYLKQDQKFKDKYFTDFYKDMEKPENLAVKEFHSHIIKINQQAADHGWLPYNQIYTFIPNIDKGFIERGTDNFNLKKLWQTFKDKYRVTPDSGLMGNIDPVTNQQVRETFVPHTQDRYNGDYSRKSKDIFRSFAMFNEDLQKAITMKELQPFSDALLRVEKAKKVIPVSNFGEKLKRKGNKNIDATPIDDDTNYKYLQMQVDWNIYGRKIQESIDKRVTFTDAKTGEQTTYSLAKFLEGGMSWIYLSAFGLNFFSPLRSYVSAKTSGWFLQGKDFTSGSLMGFEAFTTGLGIGGTESSKKIAALFGQFLPLIHNQFRKKADELSVSKLTEWTTPDNLTYFFEKGDRMNQLEIAYALLKNSALVDGELVNINRWLNKQPEYADVYNKPAREREALLKEMDKRRDEMLKEQGVLPLTTFKDGNLHIEGLKDQEQARQYFASTVQFYSQKATGQNLEWNTLGVKTSMLGRLFMMYRSWIPRTVAARLGKAKYNVQIQDYQWGRWYAFGDMALKGFKEAKLKTVAMLFGYQDKDMMIDFAKKKYIEMRDTLRKDGRVFTKDFVSEKEFVETYMQNVNNTLNELRTTALLFALVVSGMLGGGAGDDDDTKAKKSFARFQLARLLSEFTFYVNPLSFTDLFNKAIPAISFLENFTRLLQNLVQEIYGQAFDKGAADKAHPLKFLFKSMPVFSELTKFIPMIDPQMAKSMGIKTAKTSTF